MRRDLWLWPLVHLWRNDVGMETTADGSASSLGFWLSVFTVVLTIVTFGLAMLAVPNAGRNCPSDCVSYPFTGPTIADQFPLDYLWMFPAMVLLLIFVALVAYIHRWAPPDRRVYSLIGLCFAVLSAGILLMDYFIQVTVVQPSLEKDQLDGLALLTMYNPNGLFVALEELGYLLMSASLACTGLAFVGGGRAQRIIRWVTSGGLAVAVVAFVGVSVVHGLDRQDTFEVIVIVTVWLVLVVAASQMALVFRRAPVPA